MTDAAACPTLEPPSLVDASPRDLLDAGAARVATAAYRLRWRVAGPPGTHALQRVETRVRFSRGERVLVAYHAVYWEFFAFGAASEPRGDVHDFDLERDGWGPGAIARLLRARRVTAPAAPARLEVTKTFLFGAGEVEGAAAAHVTAGGGAFGFLEEVDGEPAHVALDVGDAPWPDGAARLPGPRQGRARLDAGSRWSACERLTFDFPLLEGRVERRGYVPAS